MTQIKQPPAFPARFKRPRTGRRAVYHRHERDVELTGCVMRRAKHHKLVQEIAQIR